MVPGHLSPADDLLTAVETPDGSIRVLHVDDRPGFLDLAATYLEREDDRIEVVSETDAGDALDRLADGEFDCVVSDYDMPGTNGLEFLRAVRESYPDLPFILYTGKGSEEVASEAVSAGVTDYLQKATGSEQYTLLANRIENAVEQYRSGRALERQRRRFRTLVEESTDVILVVDAFGDISYATPSAEHVLGRTPEQLVGSNGLDPIHPDDVGRAAELFDELVENPGERRSVEFRYRRPDGSYIWAEARGRNLFEDPVVEGIVIHTRDLTDRVERERQLEETNSLLSSLFDTLPLGVLAEDADRNVMAINERMFDLLDIDGTPGDVVGSDCARLAANVSGQFADPEGFTERTETVVAADESVDDEEIRLADGRTIERTHRPIDLSDGRGHLWTYRDVTERKRHERELQRRNDRLAEFTSIVSHDLRNPLQVAAGRVELVADHDLPEPAQRNLAAIDDTLDRMEALIEDLLTVAREGDTIAGTEAIPLAEIAEDCWRNVATEGTWFVVDTDRAVRADRTRLRQFFENLFRNAVEHGSTSPPSTPSQDDAVEHAGPNVTVTVGTLDDDSGFFVADDGPGIPERDRDRVFDFGYSTSEDGTGFGLRIVEQVADAHGWDVTVTESESGGVPDERSDSGSPGTASPGARFEVSGVEFVTE